MPTDELLRTLGVDGEAPAPDDAETEDGPDEEQAPSYGPNNKDLPESLQNKLKDLVKDYQLQEDFDRRREVMRDRKNRYYSRGFQHLYESGSSGIYQVATPGAMMTNASGDSVQCPSSVRDYPIFGRFELTVASVLTQNPPGVDFQPDNPNDSEDVEAAEVAEGFRRYFDRCNDVKEIQTQIVRMLLLSGRTVSYTFTEENSQKFGFEDDGTTPRKVQTTKIYGTLESKLPILAKCLEDCPYVILSDDPDVNMLKEWYPDFREEIKGGAAGIGENQYARIARLGVMQGTKSAAQVGASLNHISTRQHCFFRPAAFNGDKFEMAFESTDPADRQKNDDGTPGKPLTYREKFQQIFPQGCHVCFVGDQYVGSWDESLDDHIGVDFPYAGDGMSRMAAMDPMIVVQDDFNDDMNAYHEIAEYGWPSRYVQGEEQDLDAITDQKAAPYTYRSKKARNGQALEADFHQEPDPNIPTTLWSRTLFLMGQLAQFILAAQPALFGESMPDQKTASGYAQARAQAMGQQGIPWMAVQRLFATIYYQAAKCALRDNPDSGEIVVPNKNGTTGTYQLSKLKGNFGAYPDQDSSFPESTSAKRANLTQVLTLAMQSPQIGAQILGSPDNWEEFKEMLGTPELVIPEAQARNKQLAEIEKLLRESPIPGDPQAIQQAEIAHAADTVVATQTGQPPPPPFDPSSLDEPSVLPELMDFHEFEFAKCRDFLTSAGARREEANGNANGLRNVQLHAAFHIRMKVQLDQLMAPLAPPMPPMTLPPPAAHGAPGKPKLGGPAPSPLHKSAAPPGAPNTATL